MMNTSVCETAAKSALAPLAYAKDENHLTSKQIKLIVKAIVDAIEQHDNQIRR